MAQMSRLCVKMSVRATVDTLDFSNIRRRLLADSWSEARADTAIEEYSRFLVLASCGIRVSPCPDVDRVWHDHILHTRQYAADCASVLGMFLHHTPSTGTLEEAEKRSVTYQNMLKTYRFIFKQEPHQIWNECRPSIAVVPSVVTTAYKPDGCDC